MFDTQQWPEDAKKRLHGYFRRDRDQNSPTIPRGSCKVVYIPTVINRICGNVGLAMGIWLSQSLQIDLEILVGLLNSFVTFSPDFH